MPDDAHVTASTVPAAPLDKGTADETLNAEVRRICMIEGGYPGKWPCHARCPCCGTGELHSLFSKQGFNHDQCTTCGFVCVNPYPPDEIIRKLYAGAYYTNFREFYEARHLREVGGYSVTAAPLELLEQMIECATAGRAAARWLDVGGGLGTVADLIRRRRPGWDVTLNEFNPRSVELAAEIYGLDVVSSNARELLESGRRFDVISAVSVLEHVSDPLLFVEPYARLLTDSGVMAIIVPQFTALNAAVSKATAPNATPPFHVSLFQRRNLRSLLERVDELNHIRISQLGRRHSACCTTTTRAATRDVSIPSAEEPVPQNLKLREYPITMAMGLNALEQAKSAVGDYFAETDGRLYVMALAQRRTEIGQFHSRSRSELRESKPLPLLTAALIEPEHWCGWATRSENNSLLQQTERFAATFHEMKGLLDLQQERIFIGRQDLKRLLALTTSADGFAEHDPGLAELLWDRRITDLARQLGELVERDAEDAENDLQNGERWGRCLFNEESAKDASVALAEALGEWARTRVMYWTSRAVGLDAKLTEAKRSLARFSRLAAVAAAGASLASLQQNCLAETRRLERAYHTEKTSLARIDRNAAAEILDLHNVSDIGEAVSRSEAAHRFYLEARKAAGWWDDAGEGDVPPGLIELAAARLRQVGDERAAFDRIYSEFVRVANELIAEIRGRRGAAQS